MKTITQLQLFKKKCSGGLTFYAIIGFILAPVEFLFSILDLSTSVQDDTVLLSFILSVRVLFFLLFLVSAFGVWRLSNWSWKLTLYLLAFGIPLLLLHSAVFVFASSLTILFSKSIWYIIKSILMNGIFIIGALFWIGYFFKPKVAQQFTEEIIGNEPKIHPLGFEIIGLIMILGISIFIGYESGLAVTDLRSGHDIETLDNYSTYALPTKVYDINGELITEFFMHKRKIVPFHQLPDNLINALITMEDTRFYNHKGVDTYSIFRALYKNILAGRIVEGGSTISQQLAKLLFTDRKQKLARKFVELWLTLQIEKRYTKSEILEKYFNQVYFDHGIYGVEMASEYFFGKHVKDLTLAECAMLIAIIPKPIRYSPFRNPNKARSKQKLVLNKMVKLGFTNQKEVNESLKTFWTQLNERLVSKGPRSALEDRVNNAPYFSEYVRQFVEENFRVQLKEIVEKNLKKKNPEISKKALGKKVEKKIREVLFNGGFKIYTTLNLKKQAIARRYLQEQLAKQDKIFFSQTKHTYQRIKNRHTDLFNFIGLSFLDSSYHFRYKQAENSIHKEIKKEIGSLDFIAKIFALDKLDRLSQKYNENLEEENLSLKTEGAIVSIDPKTGYIVAMVGGRKFTKNNQLNRAVDAKRQPGSSFKAFVYGAALQSKMFYPATVLEDEELRYHDRKGSWTPGNADGKYRGPVSIRTAIKFSINTIAVKTVQKLGPQNVIKFAAPMFGFKMIPQQVDELEFENKILKKISSKKTKQYLLTYYLKNLSKKQYILKDHLKLKIKLRIFNILTYVRYEYKKSRFRNDMSIALGTSEISPLEMCRAIGVYANRGKKVIPMAILRIEDRYGIIKDYKKEAEINKNQDKQLGISDQIISPQLADLMTHLLREVTTGGTAAGAVGRAGFRRPSAGKTGTSQDSKDVWFAGYTPNLATVVWIGFDKGISLGKGQFGGNVAAPVWAKFMRDAHKDLPYKRFSRPRLRKGTVCKVTGWAQSKACLQIHDSISDFFLRGSYPTKTCPGDIMSDIEDDVIQSIFEEYKPMQIKTDTKESDIKEMKISLKPFHRESSSEIEKHFDDQKETFINKGGEFNIMEISPSKIDFIKPKRKNKRRNKRRR